MDIRKVKTEKEWEDFLGKMDYTSHFQSWSWGEFERSMGNRFDNLGIYDNNNLVGLIPLKYVEARRGKYLHIRHGPIFDFDNYEIWEIYKNFIVSKARDENYWFARMSPLILKKNENKYQKVLDEYRESPMHDVDAEITWVLDLKKTEDEIQAGMRKNTRYYIRRAERDGVKINQTGDERKLKKFWDIYKDTVERHKWAAYSREYIQNEFRIFAEKKQIELYLAYYKGKYIAAALIVYYKNQAIYHHSGSLSKYSKIPASYLLQWEAIKSAKRKGLKWYNFWGIAPIEKVNGEFVIEKGHPWKGLTFFKLGFGGEKREFVHAKDLPVSRKYLMTRIFERSEKMKRGYK